MRHYSHLIRNVKSKYIGVSSFCKLQKAKHSQHNCKQSKQIKKNYVAIVFCCIKMSQITLQKNNNWCCNSIFSIKMSQITLQQLSIT